MALVQVVEGQPTQQALIRLTLENEGHQVIAATNGHEAIELAKKHYPDLILLDILLPDIGGLDVLSRLKQLKGLQETPIVVLSANNANDDITTALDIGAQDYVTKPFNLPILNARIRSALRLAESQKALRDANQKLLQLASHDSLTGLYNRRTFMERLEEEISKVYRLQRKLSLIMLDVDHFKNVNDTYGHQAGDKVLCQLAKIITQTIRQMDIACRIGGEEFAIICTETDIDGAILLAERLRAKFTEDNVHNHHQHIHYSASFGVAELDDQEKNTSALIGLADNRLYQAKAAGRNQVCSGR